MNDYTYTRTLTAGKWNINNPNDVDGDGMAVTLATRIKTAVASPLPALLNKVTLTSTSAIVTMTQALTGPEETELDGIVSTHEAAAGTINLRTTQVWESEDGSEYTVCVDNAGVFVSTLIT